MANIIEHNSLSQAVRRGGENRLNIPQNESVSKPQTSIPASSGDTLTLTQTTSNLVKLLNSVSNFPVTDADHVEQIKHAVNSGSYEINSVSTAQKLIDLEKNIF
jgi:flagellar biosynthesis anti-sigma factor FlgM